MGKHLLAVPLEYNGGKIKGVNNKMKMINKYLKLWLIDNPIAFKILLLFIKIARKIILKYSEIRII